MSAGTNGGTPSIEGGTILAFMNEVAGGRKLLETVRDRIDAGAARVAVAAPQNQPMAGQIVDRDEIVDAARSRLEVTQAILAEFGIESEGAVFDEDPLLALDDAVRAYRPAEVLLSCLSESRYGLMRRDLVTWAQGHFEIPVTHIPVRIEDDAVRWDVNHTLVVATRTVASAGLLDRLRARAAEKPHRFTLICPRSGDISREEVCKRLARTLSDMYRNGIDATGQPMSPEPFAAVRNAIEHYRVDDILISTLEGQRSQWLEGGLLDRVKEITDKPVEHVEAGDDVSVGGPDAAEPAPVAVGAETEGGTVVQDSAGEAH